MELKIFFSPWTTCSVFFNGVVALIFGMSVCPSIYPSIKMGMREVDVEKKDETFIFIHYILITLRSTIGMKGRMNNLGMNDEIFIFIFLLYKNTSRGTRLALPGAVVMPSLAFSFERK